MGALGGILLYAMLEEYDLAGRENPAAGKERERRPGCYDALKNLVARRRSQLVESMFS